MSDAANATPSSDDAIRFALTRNWKDAIRANTKILKINSKDIDAWNRLGFAHLQCGAFAEAKKSFQKALKIDPYNQIAQKNIDRLDHIKQKDVGDLGMTGSPLVFIEEPGKTKIVQAINTAPASILSRLIAGQHVHLKPKRNCIEIRTESDIYLGAMPDDLSFKLGKLIEAGNQYTVFVKSVGKKALTVFVREIARGKRFEHQPSFIAQTQYSTVSYEGKPEESGDPTIEEKDETPVEEG